MNLTFKEKGEVIAKIVNKQVDCNDNKLRPVLEALIANYETTEFPSHVDPNQLLEDSLRAFAMVNSFEVE
jgi:hypothetical protein